MVDAGALLEESLRVLQEAGARFVLLHGSRARGEHREDSDVDLAAWWGTGAPAPFDVLLPSGVDLLVLDTAPLELAGRVALEGQVLLDDPVARVRWVAQTRKVYADELPRLQRSHAEYAEAVRRGR